MGKWILANKKADFNGIAKKYKINPVLARIMVNRGITTENEIDQFLYGDVKDMHNPLLMKDMEKAVAIIAKAINNQNKIAIATDFDNDGILSAHSLATAFSRVGGEAVIYAPDRVSEGYGLNNRIVKEAYATGIRLIVTCDNGIAALEAIQYANSLGMMVVVTDHHEVSFEEDEQGNRHFTLPEAEAIVNPKQSDCCYPFKGLCGAGVAYKLIEVLYDLFRIPKEELYNLFEYIAIATIADVMDIVDENRIIVKKGLKLIQNTKNKGLRALIQVNNLNQDKISAYHIGFVIGPCFNAAGRLDSVKIALDLLAAQSDEEAFLLAGNLKALNDSRKDMTIKGFEQAVTLIESSDLKNDKIIFVKLEETHESLVGIIAGRIRELYHRPTFVFVDVEEGLKGSGRSIEVYNMFEGLIKCKNLLDRFGGHPMAAGLSLKKDNLEELKRKINEDADLTEEDFVPIVRIDAPMPIGYISEALIEELELLEPFGKGNTKPVFAEQHFTIMKANIIGKNQNVLKMKIINDSYQSIEALYFGDVEKFSEYVTEQYGMTEVEKMYQGKLNQVDLAFTYYPSINEYMGHKTLQIIIQNYCRVQKTE